MPTNHARYLDSPAGARIAYWAGGEGPPLVMVHGSMADHTTMARLVPLLEPHFTVHVIDRRGRGASGEGCGYRIGYEYVDIAAVVDTIAERSGSAVSLYGHSYGATCALGAALRTGNVDRLALYEPAFRGVFSYPPGLLDRLDALVADGRHEQAVELAFVERVGVSAGQLDAVRALPSWAARVAAAPTVPRELRVDATLTFDPVRLGGLHRPTLLLLGERSPGGQRAVVHTIDRALPDSRIVRLAGQEHMAQLTAPELVARELIEFMSRPVAPELLARPR